MKEEFSKLTNAVYKVLEFFPESDPLKNRAKDKALAIMDNLVVIGDNSGWASFQKDKIKTQVLEDIEILLGYLWIGKAQGWMNSSNYLIISNEYDKLKKELGPAMIELTQRLPLPDKHIPKIEPVKEVQPVPTPTLNLSERQKKILEFLAKNEKAQVMDLQNVLPNITKRTIRRDLDELLVAGKIMRLGDFNQVFYKIRP